MKQNIQQFWMHDLHPYRHGIGDTPYFVTMGTNVQMSLNLRLCYIYVTTDDILAMICSKVAEIYGKAALSTSQTSLSPNIAIQIHVHSCSKS